MGNRIRVVTLTVICAGLLAISACENDADKNKGIVNQEVSQGSGDPLAIVTERAEARWKALIENDIETAYGYISPAGRELLPLRNYRMKVKSGIWEDAKVDSVACNNEICSVKVLLTYNLRDIKGLQKILEESWISEKGGWWYIQK